MISYEDVIKHYSNHKVREEIARFARGRWVGLHCSEKDVNGRNLLIRYFRGGRVPLKIENENDVTRLLQIFKNSKPRTFYATVNTYQSLNSFEDIIDISNSRGCMPTWDIDNTPEKWRATLIAAKEIISFLESNGIAKSVFVKWSGKGAHVHLHQGAISKEALAKRKPLDVAYAIVEYVNNKLHQRFNDILIEERAENLRVENKIDPQRMFTCPLSLHREMDSVCICIKSNDLDDFIPEWSSIDSYRHSYDWDEYVVGEADDLACKAFEIIGPCPATPKFRKRKHPPLDEQITKWLEKIDEISNRSFESKS